MNKVMELQMKTCPNCGERKPLDPKCWRRDKSSPNGFTNLCKLCTQETIKAHYRRFTYSDKAKRGKVGVKCLLWSPKCGVCPCVAENKLSACWRLSKIYPIDVGYPVELT